MSEIRVNVEGAPEAVVKFFKEMGQTCGTFVTESFQNTALPPVDDMNGVQISGRAEVGGELLPTIEEKKPRKQRQRKTEEKPVEEETPDPEFADLPGSESSILNEDGSDLLVTKEEDDILSEYKDEHRKAIVRKILEDGRATNLKNGVAEKTPNLNIAIVKEASKDYGVNLLQASDSAKEQVVEYIKAVYNLIAEVRASAEVDPKYFEACFYAFRDRISPELLEEYK